MPDFTVEIVSDSILMPSNRFIQCFRETNTEKIIITI